MTKEQENRRDELASKFNREFDEEKCQTDIPWASYCYGYNAGFTEGERSCLSKVIEYLNAGTKKWNDTSAYGAVDILERLEEHFADVLKGDK